MSTGRVGLAVACLLAALAGGCRREAREVDRPDMARRPETVRLTSLQPGVPAPATAKPGPYHDNAYGMSEGKRLFQAFNCVGCHAQGGGGIGPALMDDEWIYGSDPEQVFSSIIQGRPDGMPSFGGRIPEQQVWQIVAYVESLSGNVPQTAAPSRSDDEAVKRPESRTEQMPPKQTGHR